MGKASYADWLISPSPLARWSKAPVQNLRSRPVPPSLRSGARAVLPSPHRVGQAPAYHPDARHQDEERRLGSAVGGMHLHRPRVPPAGGGRNSQRCPRRRGQGSGVRRAPREGCPPVRKLKRMGSLRWASPGWPLTGARPNSCQQSHTVHQCPTRVSRALDRQLYCSCTGRSPGLSTQRL